MEDFPSKKRYLAAQDGKAATYSSFRSNFLSSDKY